MTTFAIRTPPLRPETVAKFDLLVDLVWEIGVKIHFSATEHGFVEPA